MEKFVYQRLFKGVYVDKWECIRFAKAANRVREWLKRTCRPCICIYIL